LPAIAVCQRRLHRLTHPIRQQAGSYRLEYAPLTAALRRTQNVGARLPAIAVCQLSLQRLSHPIRQQAGSYRLE
jgi:hypothetical protein